MYLSLPQADDTGSTVVISVRTGSREPQLLAKSIGAVVEREDPSAVLSFRTLDDQVSASLTQERLGSAWPRAPRCPRGRRHM